MPLLHHASHGFSAYFAGETQEDEADRSEGEGGGWVHDEAEHWTEPVLVPAPAGSVIAFSSLTPHQSDPNHSAHDRRAAILSYNPARLGEFYAVKKVNDVNPTDCFSAGRVPAVPRAVSKKCVASRVVARRNAGCARLGPSHPTLPPGRPPSLGSALARTASAPITQRRSAAWRSRSARSCRWEGRASPWRLRCSRPQRRWGTCPDPPAHPASRRAEGW